MKARSKLVIHWSKRFQEGMGYVMLGRSERLEDLYITGNFDASQIRCNKAALEETERLHTEFESIKEEKESLFSNCFTISYLNVRSLNAHLEDVSTDQLLMYSDIISFGETWLKPDQNIDFEGFKGIQENVGQGKGIAAFIKTQYTMKCQKFKCDTFSAIFMETEIIDVIFLYLSQRFSWTTLEEQFEKWIKSHKNVAVIGDMNIDFAEKQHELTRYMHRNNFTQIIENPTHDAGGMLDHIYINDRLLHQKKPFCTQRSVYFSDHDIVVLHVPKDNKI